MSKIVLLCSAGMSTSMLVSKMRAAAKDSGKEIEIHAYAMTEASEKAQDADVILLGPQVRFQENYVKEQFPDKTIAVIDMRDYGTMNGQSVLDKALAMMGDK